MKGNERVCACSTTGKNETQYEKLHSSSSSNCGVSDIIIPPHLPLSLFSPPIDTSLMISLSPPIKVSAGMRSSAIHHTVHQHPLTNHTRHDDLEMFYEIYSE